MKLFELMNLVAGCQEVCLEKHDPALCITFTYHGKASRICEAIRKDGRLPSLRNAVVRNVSANGDGELRVFIEIEEVLP